MRSRKPDLIHRLTDLEQFDGNNLQDGGNEPEEGETKVFDMEEFAKERDEALLSLDRQKILAYMRKYHVNYKPGSETVFWAGVHKAIIGINSATAEQKKKSHDWLISNGFKPYIS